LKLGGYLQPGPTLGARAELAARLSGTAVLFGEGWAQWSRPARAWDYGAAAGVRLRF
jgi:hypothetical protein